MWNHRLFFGPFKSPGKEGLFPYVYSRIAPSFFHESDFNGYMHPCHLDTASQPYKGFKKSHALRGCNRWLMTEIAMDMNIRLGVCA